MDAIYEVVSTKSFAEAVDAVIEKTKANGFRVLHVHDVQATLAEKDFKREPLKIVEVCNAKYAHTALQIAVTVSLLMPCRINVYETEGRTVISTVKPRSLAGMFDKPELQSFAEEVEDILLRIIDESK
ncbi:MAG: DUF302 domain-containing protein [Bacillota bacterium]|nr:DUF302 domain-containing protein [Bacillota bacterium]MDW7683745.1 DUF302 domain-containing protein [Bacillota bacterium]